MQNDISDAPRALKRRRTEEEEDQTISRDQWTRHPTLYIQDGTIVLLAGGTLFRVYGGLLSMHSEVFKDMFSLSHHQPSDVEIYDGCPVVRLSDSPQDLESFLETFMDVKDFSGTQQAVPFPTLSGILRISTKYIVPKLRSGAISRFDRYIPTELSHLWLRRKKQVEECFGVGREQWPQPFELVALFRECEVSRFLPWAYYFSCLKGHDALLDGYISAEKALHLSPEDAHIALRGMRTLTAIDNSITAEIYSSAAPGCQKASCNGDARIALLKKASESRRDGLPFNRVWGSFFHPCSSCLSHWRAVERAELEKTWAKLPSVFGLPPWEELLRPES